jgi:hypothetical protein
MRSSASRGSDVVLALWAATAQILRLGRNNLGPTRHKRRGQTHSLTLNNPSPVLRFRNGLLGKGLVRRAIGDGGLFRRRPITRRQSVERRAMVYLLCMFHDLAGSPRMSTYFCTAENATYSLVPCRMARAPVTWLSGFIFSPFPGRPMQKGARPGGRAAAYALQTFKQPPVS